MRTIDDDPRLDGTEAEQPAGAGCVQQACSALPLRDKAIRYIYELAAREWSEIDRGEATPTPGDLCLAAMIEIDRLKRNIKSDGDIFCGALQLLKEAGMAPGSTELIASANRFREQNDQLTRGRN